MSIMEGQDQAPISSPNTPPASPVDAAPQPAPAPSQSPAQSQSQPQSSPHKNNLRHIIILMLLSLLGLAVAGAIIYFTLHVTGVIKTISQNSDSSNGNSDTTVSELDVLKSRIEALRSNPEAYDGTLEQDLKNYEGKMINEHGKDSDQAYAATMALISYYDLFGQYETAKSHLEDRLSVAENDSKKDKYILSLYNLATKYQDTDSANRYSGEINSIISSETEAEAKAKKLVDTSWDLYLNSLEYDDNGEVIVANKDIFQKMYDMALEAETIYPTAESAILLYFLVRDYGSYLENSCELAKQYYSLAHERDPENNPIWSEEESKEEWE